VLQRATTALAPHPVHKFEWHLEGVTPAFFTDAPVGHELESPLFRACGFEWHVDLHPNGFDETGAGGLAIYLQLRTPDATAQLAGSFGVTDTTETLDASRVFSTEEQEAEEGEESHAARTWGFENFLTHDELLADLDAVAPDGVMTVTVTLQERGFAGTERRNPICVASSALAASWSSLLASGKGADVTLVCGEERLAAHSIVLALRSPVFAAQLEGPLAAPADAVPVPPEITQHTLRRLLHFLYTDELEPASPEEATHLLNAADIYAVPRLQAICEHALCAALSVDNAATTLTLADQHSAAALKAAALRFVAANAAAVMETDGWAHLVSARPPLVVEVMRTMATGAPPPLLAVKAAAGGDAARRVRPRLR
jgi:speckle-type POZ protein